MSELNIYFLTCYVHLNCANLPVEVQSRSSSEEANNYEWPRPRQTMFKPENYGHLNLSHTSKCQLRAKICDYKSIFNFS